MAGFFSSLWDGPEDPEEEKINLEEPEPEPQQPQDGAAERWNVPISVSHQLNDLFVDNDFPKEEGEGEEEEEEDNEVHREKNDIPNGSNEGVHNVHNGMDGEIHDIPNGNSIGRHEIPDETNGSAFVTLDNNLPRTVSPGESGEGLPYAPVNWPNPGDIWSWRVGKRVNVSGYYHDRFLYPPKTHQRTGRRTMLASKQAVEKYVRSLVRGADLDAFFASFSWRIPAPKESLAAEAVSLPMGDPQQDEMQKVEEVKDDTPQSFPSKRRQSAPRSSTLKPKTRGGEIGEVPEEEEESSPSFQRKRKQNSTRSLSTSRRKPGRPPSASGRKPRIYVPEGGIEDVQEDTKFAPHSGRRKGKRNAGTLPLMTKKQSKRNAAASLLTRRQTRNSSNQSFPDKGVVAPEDSMVDAIPDDFDNYLNSLEDILTQPLSAIQPFDPWDMNSYIAEDELAEARSKLSSLLVLDFASLVSSGNLSELTTLAFKLRKDPRLNAEQLVMLKLIEEIPSFSEVFLDGRKIIEQANKHFATLDANKAKVNSLKNEYKELKEKADQLQTNMDSTTLAVQEIDNQIAQLQSRRAELTSAIENSKAAKVEINFTQKMVASAIPAVVQEIQVANSKVPEWELKKRNAEQRESEVLEKFAPLKGFSL